MLYTSVFYLSLHGHSKVMRFLLFLFQFFFIVDVSLYQYIFTYSIKKKKANSLRHTETNYLLVIHSVCSKNIMSKSEKTGLRITLCG